MKRVAEGLLERCGARPDAALLLGSGFASLRRHLLVEHAIPYREIDGFPDCSIAGHDGELLFCALPGGRRLAVFAGRFHVYEGRPPEEIVRPVDLARALGARGIILTCAAGGIRDDLEAGDLVLIEDHLNLMGWTSPTPPVEFLDLSTVYDATLRELARGEAARRGATLASGVLAGLRGPAYETPAEIRMLGRLGADLVSMSTVPEAIRARALGLPVLAIACVANRAAGLGPPLLAHADVLHRVEKAVTARAELLLSILDRVGRAVAP